MDLRLPPLLQATSGALGSVAGKAIVFPLDSAVTRIQNAGPKSSADKLSIIATLYRLIRRRGVRAAYRGFSADTLSTLLSSFIYFYLYSYLHRIVLRRQSLSLPLSAANTVSKGHSRPAVPKLGATEELLIGLVAGVISKGVVLPVSAVCVRQQLDDTNRHAASTGIIDALRDIHQTEGILGLWSALPASIPLALLPSLTLYIHTLLLRLLVPARHRAHPPGIVTFGIGAMSNAIATVPLYPMVLIKVLSQSGRNPSGQLDTFQKILRQRGISGLYQGMQGQLVKGVMQQGVMMLLKQRIEEGIVKAYRTFM